MKRIAVVTLAFVAAVGCSECARQTASQATSAAPSAGPAAPAEGDPAESAEGAVTPVAFNVEGAPTVEFSVPDMVCEHSCVPEVRETLAKQPGVKDVKVELATHTATVAVDKDHFDAAKAVAALVDKQFKNTKLASATPQSAEATGNAGSVEGTATPAAPKS